MNQTIKNKCDICKRLFQPDKRAVKRQHICERLKCKLEHKRRYNQQWRARKENLDYFKGRYPYLKQWLEQHPNYLKNYRGKKKSESENKSSDIQVEITTYNNKQLDINRIFDDIQVEINDNINNGKHQIQQLLLNDIQVE